MSPAVSEFIKKASRVAVGLGGMRLINFLFDYVLYVYVVYKVGMVYGFLIMAPTATLICVYMIKAYDWSKTDWLLIEDLKSVRESTNNHGFKRILGLFLRKSEGLALIALSIWTDPFITTLYMRKGSHQYNGMSRRDWKIFFASAIVANLFWVLCSGGASAMYRYAIQFIK